MGSRWGCCSGLFQVDSLLRREQSCPVSLSPALLFSQHLSGTRKTESARIKVVCSPLAWAFKPAKITQNHSENRRGLTSQGQLRGEEMDSTLLSRIPGGPRDLAYLHIGGPLTIAMVSRLRGCVTPTWGGTLWVLPHLHGSGLWVQGDHTHKKKKKGRIHESVICV